MDTPGLPLVGRLRTSECQFVSAFLCPVRDLRIGGVKVQIYHPVEGGQPPELPEHESGMVEQRVWFPPAFEDFETAMEVTAYVCRR